MTEQPPSMTPVLAPLLQAAADRCGNDTCDEMWLPNTPAIRYWWGKALARRAAEDPGFGDPEAELARMTDGARICVFPSWLMGFLADALEQQAAGDTPCARKS